MKMSGMPGAAARRTMMTSGQETLVHRPVSSVIFMPWASNTGYAIDRLEKTFFDVALRLAGGDMDRVSFCYPKTNSGAPSWAPNGFGNVETLDIRDTRSTNLRRIRDMSRARRADFVLTFDIQPVWPAFGALRRAGVDTIVCYWGAPISAIGPWWKVQIKRALLAISRNRADGLVFESKAMAELAVKGRGVPESMVDVVPLGVDPVIFRPGLSDYAHRVLDLAPERRIIVYSGHCNERKGVHVLVDAAIELLHRRGRRDVCFVICGNKDGESDRFEARYTGLGIDHWIRFAGYRSDLPEIFRSAFCGAIASVDWDSYTLSSVEMAASGLPVVASRLQGLAESVIDGETGWLFEPGDAGQLADCIEQLLEAPESAARMGRAARERVEHDLSVSVQRDRLYQAFVRHMTVAR